MFHKIKSTFSALFFPVLLVITAALLRIPLMQARVGILPGDESVFGIMVMDVLKGHFPIYYYGQSYMGTLEVYAAAFFSLFSGVSGFTIQFGSLFFYILFLITNFYLIKRMFSVPTAVFSCILLLFPGWMMWEMGARVLGAYSSILFLSALSLLLWVKVVEEGSRIDLFLLGLVLGTGLWLNNLFFIHLLPLLLLTLFWKKDFGKRAPYLNPVRLLLLRDIAMPFWMKVPFFIIHLFVLVFILKNLIVFFTGGWEWKLFSFDFSAPPFVLVRIKKLLLLLGGEALLLALLNIHWRKLAAFLKRLFLLPLGFFIGYLPALCYNLTGSEGYRIFPKSHLIYFHELIEKSGFIFVELLPQSVWGFRLDLKGVPAGEWPAALAILGFFLAAFILFFGMHRKDLKSFVSFKGGIEQASAFFCLLTLGSVVLITLSSLEADRYFILLCWANAVVGGWLLAKIFSRWRAPAIALLVLIAGHYALEAGEHTARYSQAGITPLAQFLEKENILGGFSDYDIASQLSFYSAQRLRFLPLEGMIRLPRYKPFIDSLKRKGFVFSAKGDPEAKARALGLEKRVTELKKFGNYVIYVVDRSSAIPLT